MIHIFIMHISFYFYSISAKFLYTVVLYETPNNLLLMILHVMSLIIIIILHVFVIYLNCLQQIVNNSESLQMMKALRNRECRVTQNQSSPPSLASTRSTPKKQSGTETRQKPCGKLHN